MVKCDICDRKIEETFLGKLNGTIVKVVRDGESKKRYLCSECQKNKGEEVLKKI